MSIGIVGIFCDLLGHVTHRQDRQGSSIFQLVMLVNLILTNDKITFPLISHGNEQKSYVIPSSKNAHLFSACSNI